MSVPEPDLAHLARMTTPMGLYEHARGDQPRVEHGFCLDDVARGLVVVARQPDSDTARELLVATYLSFTLAAQDARGRFRNRRRADGRWLEPASTGDHWGRACWALGVAAGALPEPDRSRAAEAARRALGLRCVHRRSCAYAAIGAAELVAALGPDPTARALLRDVRRTARLPWADPVWPWPEPRLTYANAVLPEALIAIGVALDDEHALAGGLAALTWLVEVQLVGGHLSPVPVRGWQVGQPRPGYDQQGIEVAALAEAAWRAHRVSGQSHWLDVVAMAAAWFLGDNDGGVPLYDATTGAGFDGLTPEGPNLNRGAESTLAALATLQLAHRAGHTAGTRHDLAG